MLIFGTRRYRRKLMEDMQLPGFNLYTWARKHYIHRRYFSQLLEDYLINWEALQLVGGATE